MSDLSRIRAQLVRIEKAGRRIKAELAEERSALNLFGAQLTRAQEKRIERLEAELATQRGQWARAWDRLRTEERRLVEDPAGFLHFT